MTELRDMTIQQLQSQLEECKKSQEQLTQIRQSNYSESDAHFLQLSNDIIKLRKLVVERNLWQPFFACFRQQLTSVNHFLALYGQVVPPMAFDMQNLFTVYQTLKKEFLSRYNSLMTNTALWERFQNNIQGMQVLASYYNTFLSIDQAIPQMRLQAQAAIDQELDNQRQALLEQERQLLELLQTQQLHHARMAEILETIRQETEFSNAIEQARSFHEELSQPVGYNENNCSKLSWNLNHYNGLRIVVPAERINESRDPAICQIVSNTVLHFLRSYPAGATRLTIYDSCKMLELDKLCSDLTVANDNILDENDRSAVGDAILYKSSKKSGSDNEKKYGSEIANAFDELCDMLDSSKSQDLLRFNSTHEDAFQPIVLFVIYGCPGSFRLDKEKANQIGNARQHGVYLLIVEEENTDPDRYHTYREDNTRSVAQMRDMMTLRLTSAEPGDLQAEYAAELYRLSTPSAQFDMHQFVLDFQNRVLRQYKQPLLLDKLFTEYERGPRDFSRVLDIPVGREENGNIKLLSFNSQSSMAHLAMIGKTGSGKSSILQAIVLGGAYYYTPDEIEFYLIDMKRGDAFYKKDVVDYSKLRHVRMLSAGCSAKDLNDFISYILKTMERRATDIVAYNSTGAHREKMKRTVIVIDEYTEITDPKSVDALARIARQGRSCGISLILSSLKKGHSDILRNNVGNLIEFKNDTVGALIDDYRGTRSRSADRMFLIGRVGNCISAISESNKMSRFRAAFMPSSQQAAFIEQINAKYADYPVKDTIIVGGTQQELHSYVCADEKTNTAKADDTLLAVTVGRSIYGEDFTLEFGNDQIKKLLLIGDVRRAQSLEYSMLSAAKLAHKYFLSFEPGAAAAFRNVSVVKERAEGNTQVLQEVYGLLQDRKQNAAKATPVLLILHDCGQSDRILLREKQPQAEPVKQPKPALHTLEMSSEPFDGIDNSRYAALFDKYKNVTRYEPERPAQKQYHKSLAGMLQELLEDGIRYGICTVLSCDYDGIRKDRELLGDSIFKIFGDIIAVPSLKGDAEYAKRNLLRALDLIKASDALKKSSFNRSELVRCYRMIDKDYGQFVPYEWEELK